MSQFVPSSPNPVAVKPARTPTTIGKSASGQLPAPPEGRAVRVFLAVIMCGAAFLYGVSSRLSGEQAEARQRLIESQQAQLVDGEESRGQQDREVQRRRQRQGERQASLRQPPGTDAGDRRRAHRDRLGQATAQK